MKRRSRRACSPEAWRRQSRAEDELSLVHGGSAVVQQIAVATNMSSCIDEKRGGVLVCAASNAAADHLAEKILLTQVSVVRLYARAHNPSSSHSPSLLLESHLEALASDPNSSASEYVRLRKLRAEFAELSPLDSKHLDQLRRTAEAEVLSKADVVVCTCSTAAESRIVTRAFHFLLVDEAAQALEPESFMIYELHEPLLDSPQLRTGIAARARIYSPPFASLCAYVLSVLSAIRRRLIGSRARHTTLSGLLGRSSPSHRHRHRFSPFSFLPRYSIDARHLVR
ncbi:hypothetical protein AB1Y20_011365 [Prymnesium parvum]|uniref:DNA2/NAM7 helicase helicase domain-containing protein n=1 Tax=Prymnesium parvum TaxID=97485 RepID=A0AB34IP46_PRYPA